MKILGLDTSSSTASVAVVSAGVVLAESVASASGHHAEMVLSLTAEVLDRARIPLPAIDLIAVGIGPGSFTGIRIGIATAKGFKLSLGIPIVGVPSLEALAAAAVGARGVVATVLDARRDEVFVAAHQATLSDRRLLLGPELAKPEVAGQKVRAAAGNVEVLAIGNLGGSLWHRFVHGAGGTVTVLPAVSGTPLARFIALEAMGGHYHRDDDDRLEPVYVRPSDAKLPAGRQQE